MDDTEPANPLTASTTFATSAFMDTISWRKLPSAPTGELWRPADPEATGSAAVAAADA